MRYIKAIFRKLKFYLFFTIAIIAKKRRNDVWIISERGTDARDNAYFFSKWLSKNHPEIKVWYVIDNKSADYNKLGKNIRTVQTNSFKHYLIYCEAAIRISTHAWGGDIPIPDYYKNSLFRRFDKHKFVFLQHGITKDYQPGLKYPVIKPDIFVCSAKPEYDYVKASFGHPAGVVKYTGFARFDNLHKHTDKNQILIMPTFRKCLQGISLEDFLNSEYFVKWNDVLNNPELCSLLKANDLELIFYPHYEMQKYVSCFKSQSQYIKIADFTHYDVQQLLMESKILITDFSSVFFDFAYMRKPVIYYQFDREHYIKDHYDFTKGYFDYDTMGFGEIASSLNELINEIETCIDHDCKLEEKYNKQVDWFFELHDQNNCERIYQEIQKIL